jgi:hypothetical protein
VQFKPLRKIAFSQALEFLVVALWAFEIEAERALLCFFFARDSVSASWTSALENVGRVTTILAMHS